MKKAVFIIAVAVLVLGLAGCANHVPEEDRENVGEAAETMPVDGLEELFKEAGGQEDGEEVAEENTEHRQAEEEPDSENDALPQAAEEDSHAAAPEIPSLSLSVIEGPIYAQGDSICYYRIRAEISGSPDPQLRFSRDDSNGAWGANTAQVNLKPGQSYTLEAVAENVAGVRADSVTLEWIEQEEPQEKQVDYNDSSRFNIDVSLAEQKVRVNYDGDLLKEMICSGGTPEDPTPLGTFTTSQKIYYSWLPKYDVGAYYYIRFYGSYLFHSLPFDQEGNLIQEEAQKIGQPASHGCIRLKLEDARWLYETLPLGVEVIIH